MKTFLQTLGLTLATLPIAWAAPVDLQPEYYSKNGREAVVRFQGVFETEYKDPKALGRLSRERRKDYIANEIDPTLKFVFGPLTNRWMGSPLKTGRISVDWAGAKKVGEKVLLRYRYQGTWIIHKNLARQESFELPVPYSTRSVMSRRWKACTDTDPGNQTPDIFWYFWDPARDGCDHRDGQHYQTVQVQVGDETPNTASTRPEYDRLIRVDSQTGEKHLSMTFAFGYAEDPKQPNPDRDRDEGVVEYRKFLRFMRQAWPGASERKILQGEYLTATQKNLAIGRQFTGIRSGINVSVKVVVAAGVDPMVLFAKSFAEEHDGLFSWMGHSNLGEGFDSDYLEYIVEENSDTHSITDQYQVIYWGGCNSYSYYVDPFFRLKGGTKNLDIIANGLPSYFTVNATNSEVVFNAFFHWQRRTTYQTIVNRLEEQMAEWGDDVLVVVLGDEDNE